MPLLLGYDLGSSSIKATLMQADTGEILATAQIKAKTKFDPADIRAVEIGH